MLKRFAVLICAVAAAAPATSAAQEPGVFYDDGDSAGKEYAIPSEDARRQAGGEAKESARPDSGGAGGSGDSGGSGPTAGGRDVEAFGEGVSKQNSESGVSGGGSADGSGDTAGIAQSSSSDGAQAAGRDGGGGSAASWSVGLAVALLAAAGAAWLVRRRREAVGT